jgi:hypothetical protein
VEISRQSARQTISALSTPAMLVYVMVDSLLDPFA